jgi:pantoate--beta-alanine ligase
VLEKIETIRGVRERLAGLSSGPPREGRRRGLVPTMGALHAGHASLIAAARRDCEVVVVSIFVNPLQFNNQDDLARYPRTLDTDLAFCRELGVDVVFAPSASEMYPQPLECSVDIGHLSDHLCGAFRPGHFKGVATVVLKLFEIVQPSHAYFGEKDAQQLAIVKRLAVDFNLPIEIIEIPTMREPDGLAMSSRNRPLNPDDRRIAISLYRALERARLTIAGGERRAAVVKEAAAATIPRADALKLEYLEIVDPSTMQPVVEIAGPVRVAGALWVGSTRLIDNVLVP